jgi:hypothetical protein
MDRSRFKAILDAYGAAARRWPDRERLPAQAMAQSPDGAALVREAAEVDAALDLAGGRANTDLLAVRILRGYLMRRLLSPAPLGALAASVLLGIAVGFGAGRAAPPADAADQVLATAFEQPLELPADGTNG